MNRQKPDRNTFVIKVSVLDVSSTNLKYIRLGLISETLINTVKTIGEEIYHRVVFFFSVFGRGCLDSKVICVTLTEHKIIQR